MVDDFLFCFCYCFSFLFFVLFCFVLFFFCFLFFFCLSVFLKSNLQRMRGQIFHAKQFSKVYPAIAAREALFIFHNKNALGLGHFAQYSTKVKYLDSTYKKCQTEIINMLFIQSFSLIRIFQINSITNINSWDNCIQKQCSFVISLVQSILDLDFILQITVHGSHLTITKDKTH